MHSEGKIWRGSVRLALLTLLNAVASASDDRVHLRSLNDTSRNLRWITGARGSIPSDAVYGSVGREQPGTLTEAGGGPDVAFVCRASHNGIMLPGSLSKSSAICKVSQDGIVYSYETYDVLQNGGGRTKLTWVHWDRSVLPPSGAVDVGSSGTYYVARREGGTPDDDRRFGNAIGKLDLRDRKHNVAVTELRREKGNHRYTGNGAGAHPRVAPLKEKETTYASGKVLVAADPRFYELSIWRIASPPYNTVVEPVTLATERVVNSNYEKSEGSLIHAVLPYQSEYSVRLWLKENLLEDLITMVIDKREIEESRKRFEYKWGQPQVWRKSEEMREEIMLLPGTEANVTLVGNKTFTLTAFIAELCTNFVDDSRTCRNVSGRLDVTKLQDLKVEVGEVYSINNGKLPSPPHPDTLPETTSVSEVTSTKREPVPEAPHYDYDNDTISRTSGRPPTPLRSALNRTESHVDPTTRKDDPTEPTLTDPPAAAKETIISSTQNPYIGADTKHELLDSNKSLQTRVGKGWEHTNQSAIASGTAFWKKFTMYAPIACIIALLHF